MFHDRRMNGRAGQMDPRIVEELRKRHWAHKAAKGRLTRELDLLMDAGVPLAEAVKIVDGEPK